MCWVVRIEVIIEQAWKNLHPFALSIETEYCVLGIRSNRKRLPGACTCSLLRQLSISKLRD
jgi:hypothetical protein